MTKLVIRADQMKEMEQSEAWNKDWRLGIFDGYVVGNGNSESFDFYTW